MQVISYSNGEPGIGSPEFRKRVGFSLSMPSSNLSIYINNTQESDSGRYLCNVIIPGAAGLSGEMRLNVKGTIWTGRLVSGTFQKYLTVFWANTQRWNHKSVNCTAVCTYALGCLYNIFLQLQQMECVGTFPLPCAV